MYHVVGVSFAYCGVKVAAQVQVHALAAAQMLVRSWSWQQAAQDSTQIRFWPAQLKRVYHISKCCT